MERLLLFLREALPAPDMALWLAPALLLYTILCAGLAAWLRTRREIDTAYTRKIFHFLIISAAGVLQLTLGLSAVALFGSIVSLVVLYTVWRSEGFPFYEALARPQDAPHRTLFVLIPLFTTALGGVTANLLFPRFAYLGYLVVGWADAVGEPVGRRWGRHRYRVPSFAGVPAERSLEGSLAVFFAAVVVSFAGLAVHAPPLTMGKIFLLALAVGLAATAVEAVSHHGIDNFTLQLVAAGLTQWLI